MLDLRLYDLWLGCFYLQIERETTAFADAIWLNVHLTATFLDDMLDKSESKSNACRVHLCCALQLALPCKKPTNVFLSDSYPSVLHLHIKASPIVVVRGLYKNVAICRKLDRVLDQVDQDLLETPSVTPHFGQSYLVWVSVRIVKRFGWVLSLSGQESLSVPHNWNSLRMRLSFEYATDELDNLTGVKQSFSEGENATL